MRKIVVSVCALLANGFLWAQEPVLQQDPTLLKTIPEIQNTGITTESDPISMDCQYAFVEDPQVVGKDLVIRWTLRAVLQTFTYDYKNIKHALTQLQPCYTTSGWQSYQEAFKLSKNKKATQQEKLSVLAVLDGEGRIVGNPKIAEGKESFEILVPIKVIYASADKRLTQDLDVQVIVTTQKEGTSYKFGIYQLIATPKLKTAEDLGSSKGNAVAPEQASALQQTSSDLKI